MHHHEHDVGAESVEHAVREVHNVNDAKNQRKPDPQQRISAAENQHVDQVLQKLAQSVFPNVWTSKEARGQPRASSIRNRTLKRLHANLAVIDFDQIDIGLALTTFLT